MEEAVKFYDKDGIIVRRAIKDDVEFLCDKLRQSDVNEVWASSHKTPEEALTYSLDKSIFALTIVNSNPIGMFGIAPDIILGDKASVWFLASDELESIGRRFIKNSRRFIDIMLDYYPYLFNFVDERNQESIKWLRLCGATIEEPQPYGKENLPFRYFYFERGGKDV